MWGVPNWAPETVNQSVPSPQEHSDSISKGETEAERWFVPVGAPSTALPRLDALAQLPLPSWQPSPTPEAPDSADRSYHALTASIRHQLWAGGAGMPLFSGP